MEIIRARYIKLILAIVLLYSSVIHSSNDDVPKNIINKARGLVPEAELKFVNSKDFGEQHIILSRFSYYHPSEWPYGVLHILWYKETKEPIWSFNWRGDFTPHSIAMLDINADGQKDIFFYAGFEDVFSTHVYLSKTRNSSYSENNYIKTYSNENSYSVLLDFDHDGIPEILDSGLEGDEYISNACTGYDYSSVIIPEEVQLKMIEEYDRLVGIFDSFNFKYGTKSSYKSISMNILEPIKILQIRGANLNDVTRNFSAHIKWRLSILEMIRKRNTGECLKYIESMITKNKSYIELSQSNN